MAPVNAGAVPSDSLAEDTAAERSDPTVFPAPVTSADALLSVALAEMSVEREEARDSRAVPPSAVAVSATWLVGTVEDCAATRALSEARMMVAICILSAP